jgi:hypothetical protein
MTQTYDSTLVMQELLYEHFNEKIKWEVHADIIINPDNKGVKAGVRRSNYGHPTPEFDVFLEVPQILMEQEDHYGVIKGELGVLLGHIASGQMTGVKGYIGAILSRSPITKKPLDYIAKAEAKNAAKKAGLKEEVRLATDYHNQFMKQQVDSIREPMEAERDRLRKLL